MSTPHEALEQLKRYPLVESEHSWREPLLWGVALGFVIGLGVALVVFAAGCALGALWP